MHVQEDLSSDQMLKTRYNMDLEETINGMQRIEKNIHKYWQFPEVRDKMILKYRELYDHATGKLGMNYSHDHYGKSTNWLSLHEKVGAL